MSVYKYILPENRMLFAQVGLALVFSDNWLILFSKASCVVGVGELTITLTNTSRALFSFLADFEISDLGISLTCPVSLTFLTVLDTVDWTI